VPFDLVPEPPPDVRSALDRLLERESTSEERQSAWWLAGIQEAVGDSDSEEP
jgi:hypothetical protein